MGVLKTSIFFVAGLVALVGVALAAINIELGWEYATTPGDFNHFRIDQLAADGSTWNDVSGNLDATARSFVVVGLADGTYTFRCVAVDTTNLEGLSDNVVIAVEDTSGPPPAPQNFRVISEIVVEIRNGQVVAYTANSRVEPILPGE